MQQNAAIIVTNVLTQGNTNDQQMLLVPQYCRTDEMNFSMLVFKLLECQPETLIKEFKICFMGASA